MTDKFKQALRNLIEDAIYRTAAEWPTDADTLMRRRATITYAATDILVERWYVARQIESLMVKRRQRRNRKAKP